MHTKQSILISILVVGSILAGLLVFQTLAIGDVKAVANSPVGSWKVTVSPEGGPSFTDGVIFSSDGTLIVMEDNGVIGLGVWEKLSGIQYSFTIWEYFSQDGSNLQGKVRSTFTLNVDKEQYNGPFVFQISDLDGNLIVDGSGTAIGVRNHVEPMP